MLPPPKKKRIKKAIGLSDILGFSQHVKYLQTFVDQLPNLQSYEKVFWNWEGIHGMKNYDFPE